MSERIAPVGYINDDREHAMISIFDPAILNANQREKYVQVVLSIEGAINLRAELNSFLARHGIRAN